ncbi:MAG TPA: hypothetical protein VL995_18590 [Cellvibrio sp.]|nr:hypothetical protein [Cellvibrio sp.]
MKTITINSLLLGALLSLTQGTLAEAVFDLRGDAAQSRLNELRATLKADANNTQALKDAGIILHQLNRGAPDKKLVEEGEKYLKLAVRNAADDVETLAWLGSITTMKAQFDTDPGRQTFFVKSGSQKMDSAVRKAPDNQVVRLTRAYNSLEIPPFLKRTRFAVEDFQHYLKLCEQQTCADKDVAAAKQGLEQAQKIVAGNQ